MSNAVSMTGNVNLFKGSPLRDAAGEYGRLPADSIAKGVAVAQKAFMTRLGQLAAGKSGPATLTALKLDDAPQLTEPKQYDAASPAPTLEDVSQAVVSTTQLSGAAVVTLAVGRLTKAATNSDLASLQADTALWDSFSIRERLRLDILQGEYDTASQDEQQAQADEKTAEQQVQDAQNSLKQAQQNETQAQKAYNSADKAYNDAVKKGEPQDQLDSLKSDCDSAKDALNSAQAEVTNAQAKLNTADQALTQSKDALSAAKVNADSAHKALTSSINDVCAKNVQVQAAFTQDNGQLTGAAALTAFMGKLGELGAKASMNELDAKHELFEQQQAASQAEAKKNSDDFEAQQQKAEQMQKTMGCIGKILGAVVAVIGVVAAAFTGGASLALAGIGLALCVADQIDQAVTGNSFIAQAMQPLMDHVLKPLMNLLSDAVTKVLEDCGVSEDKAKLAGSVIGAVLTGAALIAAAVVGGSAVSEMATQLVGAISSQLAEMAETVVGKMISELVDGVAEGMDSALEKSGVKDLMAKMSTGMDRLKTSIGADTKEGAEKIAVRLKYVAETTSVANAATQTGLGIESGEAQKGAMDALAEMKRALANNQLFSQLMSQAVDTYSQQIKALMQLMQSASAASADQFGTANTVLANARAI